MDGEYPVARDFRTRLRGLAWRERRDAGPGLLIPCCSSVHTFGMRFALDVYFLDREGRVISVRRRVPPRRVVWHRGAAAVLEIPASCGNYTSEGGEPAPVAPLEAHAATTRRDRHPGRLRGRRRHP